MSLRMSPDDALKRGLIDAATAKQIKAGENRRLPQQAPGKPKAPAANTPAAGDINSDTSPQRILFEALCRRLPGRPQWEVGNLVPGRRIRADIFIPPCVIVEMDGFRFHRSLEAFKQDRRRQNLLTSLGYLVFRTFAKEVLDDQERHSLVEMIAATVETKARNVGLQFQEET
ncbi:TPA: DUF559 domain-containing protein [Pseudomonas aeruginosa]|nr:DUF559 domain-containing protein [Pseudomonas aeruginosa]EIU2862507.1 DUF559 domain-containing protein [Pseudomonas aeruginosa]